MTMITVKNISPIEDFIFMRMTEGENVLCEATAQIDGDMAKLIDITEYESGFGFDIGKATLNIIDLKGVKNVICNNEILNDILVRLGFNKDNCAYLLSLEGYFVANCKKI